MYAIAAVRNSKELAPICAARNAIPRIINALNKEKGNGKIKNE